MWKWHLETDLLVHGVVGTEDLRYYCLRVRTWRVELQGPGIAETGNRLLMLMRQTRDRKTQAAGG